MNSKSKYYAVKIGRVPGIYRSWSECEKQVKGFPDCCHKSFKNLKDAQKFIGQIEEEPIDLDQLVPLSHSNVNEMFTFDIYTDGSHQRDKDYLGIGAWCRHNTREFELSSSCNRELLLSYGITETTVSSPTAEFIAFAEVLKKFYDNLKDSKELSIHMHDLTLQFHCDYEGVENWMKGSWKTKKSYIRKIKEECDRMIAEMNCQVLIKHVDAHSGNEGNDKADKLAGDHNHRDNFGELFILLKKDWDY